MQIRAFRTNSVKGFRQCWEQRESESFIPNAAVIFSSVSLNIREISEFLEPRGVKVFGSSSCGEFLYDSGEKVISEDGLVCAMLMLEPGSFDTKMFNGEGQSSFQLGKTAGNWASGIFANPHVLVVSSGLMTDGEQLVKGIQESTGSEVKIYGGLAGDDARFRETLVFSETEILPNACLVMVLDSNKYEIEGLATSGWVSIGADKTITRAEGNIVYTIDNQPALDVYKQYLNVNDNDLPEIGVEYPLLIRKNETDVVIRAVLNVDREKKALIFAGTVPEGAVVTFSSSPGFEIIDSTRKKVQEFYDHNNRADLLVLFSCMARHNALGPTISEEIEAAWSRWQKPLIGFFTYGEIGGSYNSACEFHNQTFTLVSIKNRQDVP
jgi:hypothetical protein